MKYKIIQWLWDQFPADLISMAKGSVMLPQAAGFITPKGTKIQYGTVKYWVWCHNRGDWKE